MTPAIKATIVLPFLIGLLTLIGYIVTMYPLILVVMLLFASILGIIGALWYGLYTTFGGEV